MLTRFFGTTKPSAIIVVLAYMTAGFFYSNKIIFTTPFNAINVLKIVGMWLLFILAMFILNFISQKNELTKRNAYRILLFAGFSLALPVAMRDAAVLLASVLLLTSLRRVISMRSGLHMERKIFDAALWVCLASLIYFYSWHFLLAIYLGMLFYNTINVRYLFIPVLAIVCASIIGYAILLGLDNGSALLASYPKKISLNFQAYNNPQILIAVAFLLGVLIWTIWSYIGELQRASASGRSRYSVILAILFVGLSFIMLTPDKTGAEWYFVLPILSIIVSNYLDTTKSLLFKESLLWLIVLLPILIHVV